MNIDPTAIIAVLLGGSFLTGLALYRKSGKEADQAQAQAAATVVGAADDVVALIRREMTAHLAETDARIVHLEQTVTAWDGWADRVLDILDRALGMLTDEQKAAMRPDVENAHETRPPRRHHYHDKRAPKQEG